MLTRPTSLAISAIVAVAMLGACSRDSSAQALADRQQAVAAAGAEVMPFDLDATTHVFEKNETGGIQRVLADTPGDEAEIELIRLHLEEEANRFRVGDFSDPAAIHGSDMPGLAILAERAPEIGVTVQLIEHGASITYATNEPDLVDAIHDWFDAQVTDHGSHAEMSRTG